MLRAMRERSSAVMRSSRNGESRRRGRKRRKVSEEEEDKEWWSRLQCARGGLMSGGVCGVWARVAQTAEIRAMTSDTSDAKIPVPICQYASSFHLSLQVFSISISSFAVRQQATSHVLHVRH